MSSTLLKEDLHRKENQEKVSKERVRKELMRNVKQCIDTKKKTVDKEEETCPTCQIFGTANELWWRYRSCG